MLGAGNLGIVDACQVSDITLGQYLIATNINNQILRIDPKTQALSNLIPTAAKQPSTGGFTAQCVAYVVGRVFAANLNDGSLGLARTRIRWSKTTDTTDFSDPTAYIDLMSQSAAFSGAIQRMIPLGTTLVCYLDDAIFIGTPSNTPNLPLAFQQLPGGNIGIAGPRAVASVMLPRDESNVWGINTTGHFFVGFDNVYFLSSSNLSLAPIGTRMVRESIYRCQYPSKIQTSIDWARKRVRFGFPRSTPQIENIFEYCWESKEWSYEVRNTWMMGDISIANTWSDVNMQDVLGNNMATVSADTMVLGWVATGNFVHTHYVEHNGALWSSAWNENALNPDSSAIPISIQTPDYDEGAPGMVKFWRMLRVKLTWEPETVPAVPISFLIEISLNRGRTWRPAGTMNILVGNDEGYVNFRATGPHIRFRITSSSSVTPYTIVELTRMCSIRGTQDSLRQQNAVH
jgi:hypothetical protein